MHDAFAVIAQPEASFDDARHGQQFGGNLSARRVMQLNHPTRLCCGQLQDMGTVGYLADLERRFGLGVKPPGRVLKQLFPCMQSLFFIAHQMDAVKV